MRTHSGPWARPLTWSCSEDARVRSRTLYFDSQLPNKLIIYILYMTNEICSVLFNRTQINAVLASKYIFEALSYLGLLSCLSNNWKELNFLSNDCLGNHSNTTSAYIDSSNYPIISHFWPVFRNVSVVEARSPTLMNQGFHFWSRRISAEVRRRSIQFTRLHSGFGAGACDSGFMFRLEDPGESSSGWNITGQ